MLTARGGTACEIITDTLIEVGGEGNLNSPSGLFSQVERYVAATDGWQTLAPTRTSWHGGGSDRGSALRPRRRYLGWIWRGRSARNTHAVRRPKTRRYNERLKADAMHYVGRRVATYAMPPSIRLMQPIINVKSINDCQDFLARSRALQPRDACDDGV